MLMWQAGEGIYGSVAAKNASLLATGRADIWSVLTGKHGGIQLEFSRILLHLSHIDLLKGTCMRYLADAVRCHCRKLAGGVLLLAVLAGLAQALAGESPARAGKLAASGEILSLEKISRLARTHQPGEILEVELEKKHGRYVYEVEILDQHSQVWELKLDAKSGQLLKMEQDD